MFNEYISKYYDLAANTYHVNPVIYLVIYLASIPIFYVAFYFVIKELLRIKKEDKKITPGHFVEEKKLAAWSLVLLFVYLAPYIYVGFWGQNLPVWSWPLIAALLAFSGYTLYKKISKSLKKS